MIFIPYFNRAIKTLTLAALLALAQSANGQQSPAAQTWRLAKVEVTGLNRLNQEQVLAVSGLKIGQKIDLAALNAATDLLRRTGFFITIGYKYNYIDDQLYVTFQVEEAKWAVPVVFDNFVWFTDEEIKNAVRQTVPTFDGFAPRSGEVIKTISATLERLLSEKNIQGQVEYLPSYEQSGADKEHIFSVKGLSMKICMLSFPGTAAVKESELIKQSKPLFDSEYSRSFVAEFVKSNLIPVYRERGHLRAGFRVPQARFETTSDCKNGVGVTLAVDEGAVYLWDKSEWTGNNALSTEELESLLTMKPGELANGLKIDSGVKTLREAYGKKGFITARLNVTPSFDDASRHVVYRFTINEGPQYRMGEINVAGMPEGEVEKLKKKWKLQQGEIYNAAYAGEFMKTTVRDNKVGNFTLKSVSIKPDPQKLTVDVFFGFK